MLNKNPGGSRLSYPSPKVKQIALHHPSVRNLLPILVWVKCSSFSLAGALGRRSSQTVQQTLGAWLLILAAQPSPLLLAEVQRKSPLSGPPSLPTLFRRPLAASFLSTPTPLQASRSVPVHRDPLQGHRPPPWNPYLQGSAPHSSTCQFSQERWFQLAAQVLRPDPSLLGQMGPRWSLQLLTSQDCKGLGPTNRGKRRKRAKLVRGHLPQTLLLLTSTEKMLRTISSFFKKITN